MNATTDDTRAPLRASNWQALQLLVLPALLGAALFATLEEEWPLYLLGQFAGALFFVQAFILLHEFGHRSFFPARWANVLSGYLVSVLVFLPFPNWAAIHDLHHRWTGYRDKDPTTENTFAARLSPRQQRLVNFCWRWSVPLFTLGYRVGIYWKVEKLRRHLSPRKFRSCLAHMLVYLLLYAALIVFIPGILLALLPALLLSFVICDVLTLSQHSHVAMPLAGAEDVKPLAYSAQVQYSRSLVFPHWLARYVLFNFNWHEAHHAQPGVPCYRLQPVEDSPGRSFPFWSWLRRVKKVSGVDFIFRADSQQKDF